MDWPKMILLSGVHCITFCTLFLRTDLSHSSKLRAVTFARQIEWGDLKDRKEKTLSSALTVLKKKAFITNVFLFEEMCKKEKTHSFCFQSVIHNS